MNSSTHQPVTGLWVEFQWTSTKCR